MTMNNLYHWHDERMNALKMQEINQEIERMYLLKEAGLSEPGILTRAARALGSWLKVQSQRRQARRSDNLPLQRTTDDQSGR
jgi:hypothetical protein